MAPTEENFELFTSLRYDPILLESNENSSNLFSFRSPSPFYMLIYHRDRMLEAAQHFDWNPVAEKLANGIALEETLQDEVRKYLKETGKENGPLKLKLLFNRAGSLKAEFTPLPAVPITTLYPESLTPDAKKDSPAAWLLTIDTKQTPSTDHTSLKTTYRDHYDASRSRTLPISVDQTVSQTIPKGSDTHEVMLFNQVDEMTEGSMTSLYFYRGGRWVTPPVGVPAGRFSSNDRTVDSDTRSDEGELREAFPGRWGHSLRSAKVGSGGQRGTTRRWALGKGLCVEEIVTKQTVTNGERVWISNGVRGFNCGTVVY